MTAIASYYASVGVGIDKNSLNNVQKYLESIQKKMESFQSKMNKSSNLSIRIDNVSISQTALRNAIKVASSNQRIRLDKVSIGSIGVNNAQISKAVRAALQTNTTGGAKQYKVNLGSFDVSTQKLVSALNRSLRTTTSNKNTSIHLNNFSVSQKALVDAINKAVNREGPYSRIRIGALLSQSSLTAMRQQIRQAINQLVVNPTINPRISQARIRETQRRVGDGGGGTVGDRLKTRDPRRMNPWYNPLMIGGAPGAFLRYGVFSLPFIAGAYGLNTLNTFASTAASQRTSLDMVSSMSTMGRTGDDNREFLRGLAQRIGKTSMGMTPIYTQMLAASTGTELEPQMQDMFSGILQYASVMGLGEESIKRAMVGF